VDEITEQSEGYQYLNEVAIIYGGEAFSGGYICTYYKDGKSPVLSVNLDGGVGPLLK